MSISSVVVCGLLSWGVVSFSVLAQEPISDGPGEVSEQFFKDWGIRCQGSTDAGPHACYLFQDVFRKDTGQRLAQVAVGRTDVGNTMAIITLPVDVLLSNGVSLRIDDKASLPVLMQVCDASGCHGRVLLDDTLLLMLKHGRRATIYYQRRDGGSLAVPVSLRGFTAAVEAMRGG